MLLLILSLLSRGAWIEIQAKFSELWKKARRSSHEERGLKSNVVQFKAAYNLSLLSRGAWIEIH